MIQAKTHSSALGHEPVTECLTLNPGMRLIPFKNGFRAWGPLRRKDLFLLPEDVALLCQFTQGGLKISDIDPSGIKTGTAGLYLKTTSFREAGLLVPQLYLEPVQLGQVLFGEFPPKTAEFYATRFYPHHSIPLVSLPHLDFLSHHLERPYGDHDFAASLDVQGTDDNPCVPTAVRVEERNHYLEWCLATYRRFAEAKDAEAVMCEHPFQLCPRPDGRFVLYDQAFRACIALALGLKVRAVLLDPRDYLGRLSENPSEFFGSMLEKKPYHTIFHRGQVMVEGVRDDIYARLNKIPDIYLQGKRVLDLGSNVGMSCFAAFEKGATSCLGLETRDNLISTAVRLGAWFSYDCRFLRRDLNLAHRDLGAFDTAFFFSVLGHLKGADPILETLWNSGVSSVFFETHSSIQPQGELDRFLGSDLFESVQLLGHNSDNTRRGTATRALYFCKVAGK